MNEEMVQQLMATAEKLANAAESLDRVLGRLDAQQEALNTKVDRSWRRWKSSRPMRFRRGEKARDVCRNESRNWRNPMRT